MSARPTWIALLLAGLMSCRHGRPSDGVHIVTPGETLTEIADRYGVPLERLVQTNKLADPNHIYVDQKIVIPSEPEAPSDADREAEEEGRAEEADREIDEAVVRLEATDEPLPSAPESPTPLVWPVEGVVISLFGEDDGARHDGIDIAAPEGTPIWAAADGEVLFAGEQTGYGLILILRHEGDLVTVYGHNLENLVHEREQVKKGQPVGRVGQSGGQLTPALHFEVRKGAVATNPLTLLPR